MCPSKVGSLVTAMLSCAFACADVTLEIETPAGRQAFYRDESPHVTVTIANSGPAPLSGAELRLSCTEYISHVERLDEILAENPVSKSVRLPLSRLKAGDYEIKATLTRGAESIAEKSMALSTAHRPNPDRLMVWLWGGGGTPWYLDHGFTTWSGPYWSSDLTAEATVRALDTGLLLGADVGIHANGGLTDIGPAYMQNPDARNLAIEAYHKDPVANPFHQDVAQAQDNANRKLMEFIRHFPQVHTAFFNTEIVDALEVNRNEAGIQLAMDTLGFTEPPTGDPTYVAAGVIPDDDPAYRYHKFKYQRGNGLALANARTAAMIERYRPDIITVNDPYREAAYLDMFPGLDCVSTWTYTNPDPKLMLYIETLRAVCKPTGQIPMHTVTLLNYPGELAPTGEWMLMGPARLTVTTWINLSRAPKMIGYYYSSECNPEGADSNKVPYATSAKLKELSERVFQPYGPMLTQLDVAPRRTAVLSSAAARVHGKSPNLLGGYDNLQIYHFYTVLAMAHVQADVILDETIERYGLDDYDVLVLPKCDVLTETVYKTILAFQRRGGMVIADQYLGPEIPGAIQFDFDFTYRKKVSANAIEKNAVFAQWNDQLQPGSAELAQVTGVTALDDQRIMESYAASLKHRLDGIVNAEIECDSPKILLSTLEKDGAKYLVVINDNRAYDDREGKYKAVLGKMLPHTARIFVKDWPGENLVAYDLLTRTPLEAVPEASGYAFQVHVSELGGTIIALYSSKITSLEVQVRPQIKAAHPATIDVTLKDASNLMVPGLQPLRIDVHDASGKRSPYSGYYCARNGAIAIPFLAGMNDARGPWSVQVEDLTSGSSARTSFELVD